MIHTCRDTGLRRHSRCVGGTVYIQYKRLVKVFGSPGSGDAFSSRERRYGFLVSVHYAIARSLFGDQNSYYPLLFVFFLLLCSVAVH